MLLLKFQGINADQISYRLKKNPTKFFHREDTLSFLGAYTKYEPTHVEFLLTSTLNAKEFHRNQERQQNLSLEGMADPTGQVVERYWLAQCANNLGDLLKPAAEPLTLTVTFECPAAFLHHTNILRETLAELGWKTEITRLDAEHNLENLLGPEANQGMHRICVTKEGEVHACFQQFWLLLNCFTKGMHFEPNESNVSKLLRLGHPWLAPLTHAARIAGYYLGGDRKLEAVAARELGITPKDIARAVAQDTTKTTPTDILSYWWNHEQPALDILWTKFATIADKDTWVHTSKIIRQLTHLVRAAKQNAGGDNPFPPKPSAEPWEAAIQQSAHAFFSNQTEAGFLTFAKAVTTNQPDKGFHQLRHEWIAKQVTGATALLELGANTGACSEFLLNTIESLAELTLVDRVDHWLVKAGYRLDRLKKDTEIKLLVSNLVYCDPRWSQPRYQEKWDAVVLCEVIEHLSPTALEQTLRNLFRHCKTDRLVLTTPNRAWNRLLQTSGIDDLRLDDHQFEWTMQEAKVWAETVANRFQKTVTISGIGRDIEGYGTPSIGMVFTNPTTA